MGWDRDRMALTVNIQPGGTGRDPCFVLGRHRVPPGILPRGPLDEQAEGAAAVLVHAAGKTGPSGAHFAKGALHTKCHLY